jgi:hypothetical protein
MKVEWQADDIKPGRRYGKPDTKERWLIGYVAGTECLETPSKRYVSISLSDGMVTQSLTAADMAAVLNKYGYQPEELLPPA